MGRIGCVPMSNLLDPTINILLYLLYHIQSIPILTGFRICELACH